MGLMLTWKRQRHQMLPKKDRERKEREKRDWSLGRQDKQKFTGEEQRKHLCRMEVGWCIIKNVHTNHWSTTIQS